MRTRVATGSNRIVKKGGAYEGRAGKTRTESVHVVMADGTLRSVELYRVINVETHPELRARALSGDLHRLPDGRELKMTFVYHDPQACKFALVIPGELSHQELKERAALLNELAEDREHPVPAYVRSCTSLIGVEALRAFLSAPLFVDEGDFSRLPPAEQRQKLKARKEIIAGIERELAQKERDIFSTVARIGANEEQSRERLRDLEEEVRDLVLRIEALEKGVDDRFRAFRTASGSGRPAAISADGDWREVSSLNPESVVPAEVVTDEGSQASLDDAESTTAVESAEVVEEQELEEVVVATAVRQGISMAPNRVSAPFPPPLRLEKTGAFPPPLVHLNRSGSAMNQRYVPFDIGAGKSEGEPPPLPRSRLAREDPAKSDPSVAVANPDLDPPPHFLSSDKEQMSISLDREPWLFVRVDAVHKNAFQESIDLLVQYVVVDGFPVVFLTLVESQTAKAYACRAVLDPFAESDRRFLEALGRSYGARVALFCGETYLETRTVEAPREKLVLEILGLTENLPASATGSAAEALKHAIEQPPDFVTDDTPFRYATAPPTTLTATMDATELFAPWLSEEKLRHARFTYSIPAHLLDFSIRNVIDSALKLGVALPQPLSIWAIEHEMIEDLAEAVRAQLSAFAARSDQAIKELGIETTAANWRLLLETAETCKVEEIEPAIYEVAARDIDAANALLNGEK